MRFGGRLSRAAFAGLIDERHDRIRRSAGSLPLYGLLDWSGPRMIGQWGWSDGALHTAGLAYGVRGGTGPWTEIITTAGPAEQWVTDQRSAMAFAAQRDSDDEALRSALDAVTAEPPAEVAIEVDGAPRPFRYWRGQPVGGDHPDWYAALAGTPGLVVTASGLRPGELRLAAVAEVEPYLLATREHLLASYDAAPPADG